MKIKRKYIDGARELRQWIMLGVSLKIAFPEEAERLANKWRKAKFRVKNGVSFENYVKDQNRVLH